MAEHRGEQRQLRFDVGTLAIPAQQRAQHERMADVVQPGLAPERFPVQAGRVTELIEPSPDEVPVSRAPLPERKKAAGSLGWEHSSSRLRT